MDREAVAAGLNGQGALVTNVQPASPAERAELGRGMLITEVGGKPVKSARDLEAVIKAAKPGSVLLLRAQFRDPRTNEEVRELRALTLP